MTGAERHLAALNTGSSAEAAALLRRACGCARWIDGMIARRPFADAAALHSAAEREFDLLRREDWLEAFSSHPRIGERGISAARHGAGAAVAAKEQSGMAVATDAEREAFAAGNRAYEDRFGHVFLICATGKSAGEMLAQLRERVDNDGATELQNAAREQRLITRLRLERWLAS